MVPIGNPFTFTSPYAVGPESAPELAARKGTRARVVAHLASNSPTHDFDEVGPMYRIRFEVDGLEIEAWPEEVEGQ